MAITLDACPPVAGRRPVRLAWIPSAARLSVNSLDEVEARTGDDR